MTYRYYPQLTLFHIPDACDPCYRTGRVRWSSTCRLWLVVHKSYPEFFALAHPYCCDKPNLLWIKKKLWVDSCIVFKRSKYLCIKKKFLIKIDFNLKDVATEEMRHTCHSRQHLWRKSLYQHRTFALPIQSLSWNQLVQSQHWVLQDNWVFQDKSFFQIWHISINQLSLSAFLGITYVLMCNGPSSEITFTCKF